MSDVESRQRMALNKPQNSIGEAQERLQVLAKRYADELPQKIAEMDRLYQALISNGWSQVEGETLHRMLHSMAGTAGTMGFPQVGRIARSLEQILKESVRGQSELAAHTEVVQAEFERLWAAIELPSTNAVTQTMAIPLASPMKILVADDDPVGQAVLVSLLAADGHSVITANDGLEAVACFHESRPDLVFMDVIMPNLNGYDAARQIKASCGKHFVPMIFLTALQDENDLAACIAAGGDDFVVKPYNSVLLKSKLIAMQRIRGLYHELSIYQQRTAEEIELSTHVFDAITNRNPEIAAVQHWYSAVGHFSGDIVLYQRAPSGRFLLMLGDFTGHGLGAALAAVPVSDLFYHLVDDEVALPDLVFAINRKLKSVMPIGRFCAALLIEINAEGTYAAIWNGGIPGAYLLDGAGTIQVRIASTKLPLGVIGDQGFDAQPERVPLEPHTQFLFFTDGVNEARNPQGNMLTVAGVEKMFSHGDVFSALRTGVANHLAGQEADDDVSIVVINRDGVSSQHGSDAGCA